MAKKNKIKYADFSRREFIKIGGAVAAGLQIGAVAGAGMAAGKDPSTHTGWQHLGDNTQFVDRKKLQITGPAYEITGETRRPDLVESVFNRNPIIRQQMRVEGRRMAPIPDAGEERQEGRGLTRSEIEDKTGETGLMASPESAPDIAPESTGGMVQGEPPTQQFPPVDNFPEPLLSHYRKHPHVYDLDKIRIEEVIPKRAKDVEKYGEFYTLINAWSGSWQTSERITTPPEVSDFHLGSGRRAREIGKPLPFKSPVHAARLIKKVTHHFGAAMVGITTINPDWCYNHSLRGSKDRGSYEVPKHWEYIIAFGVPHQWEQVNSNPNFGTSFDAYSRASIAARRLETFIKILGYPARRHSPMDGYDVIAVPYLVKAGLGQQGRHGIIITPETGSNFRAAFVTTSLPLEIDHPIDFGVKEFCAHCKICAEICPSSSISFEENNEKMNTRGYRHWEINQTSCFNFWMQSMGGMGCRLCLIACPYSRKNNWVHGLARNVDIHDPTGLTEKGLTFMQKKLFDAPEAYEYLPPPDGNLSNFREQPEWLRVEEYLDIDVTDPTKEGIS